MLMIKCCPRAVPAKAGAAAMQGRIYTCAPAISLAESACQQQVLGVARQQQSLGGPEPLLDAAKP